MSITTALKARREALRDREAGFTLIELLVVVIIIGILAAIAIPIYVGVQNNAKEAGVKSDLTNAKTAVVSYWQDNTAAGLPTLTVAALKQYGFTLNTANYSTGSTDIPTFASGSAQATGWCIQAKSVTGNQFNVSSSGAVASGACGAASTW